MTTQQEKKFDAMHDAVISMSATLIPKVESLEHAVHGNGKPGLKVDVSLIKQSIKRLEKKHERGETIAPSKRSNIIATFAVICAIISPFIAHWLNS